MEKINKNRLWNKKARISYFEIFLLITMTFAFAYLIQDSIQIVSAQDDPIQCCEETIDGNYCQEFPTDDILGECKTSGFPGRCESLSSCETGCCYDPVEGTCGSGSPEMLCSGEWTNNAACNIRECEMACCVLGTDAQLTTERTCNKLASESGLEVDFRTDVRSELQCILATAGEDRGACVFEDGDGNNCEFTTRSKCVLLTGSDSNFNKDFLCSNPILNTICIKQDHKGCIEDSEGVYWFDSCGNPENIFDIDKTRSWNNGIFLNPVNSCGTDSDNGNANSNSCGNCNYILGSTCGQQDDDFICKDLDCTLPDGTRKMNGESWCQYEGTIGEGRDVAGSSHFTKSCYKGDIITTPCADYRNEICVESTSDTILGDFTEASCRLNRWRECAEINLEEDEDIKKQKCDDNTDCEFGKIEIDEYFKFPICTPQYPPGLDKDHPNDAKTVCTQATLVCPATEVKDIGGWDWVANEDCTEQEFTEKMNDFCRKLGDCGGYVNLVGDYDQGFYIGGDREPPNSIPQSKINEYKDYSDPNPNQAPAEPGDVGAIEEVTSTDDAEIDGISAETGSLVGGVGGIIGGVAGSAGLLGGLGSSLAGSKSVSFLYSWLIPQAQPVTTLGATFVPTHIPGVALPVPTVTTTTPAPAYGATPQGGVAGFGNFLGAGLGAMAGTYVMMALLGEDLPPNAALLASLIGGVVGSAAGLAAGAAAMTSATAAAGGVAPTGLAAFGATFGPAFVAAFVWAAIVVGVVLIIMELAGIGDKKDYEIEFHCQPWQAPAGVSDSTCDKCNEGDIPCTDYRCESLGQTCELINKGTGFDKCINNAPSDVSSPRIDPLYTVITPGYGYSNVQANRGFKVVQSSDGSCIPEYTNILFGIKTNKPSQCRVDEDPLEPYTTMAEPFGGNPFYVEEHTMQMFMLSPPAFGNRYNLTQAQIAAMGKKEFYVKCKSVNGVMNTVAYKIESCVNPGNDSRAPWIVRTSPANTGIVRFDVDEQDTMFWINEPAECKWSKGDKSYADMENQMSCENDFDDYDIYRGGWPCNATLTNITKGDNTFYVKCQDTSENKNTRVQSENYVLIKPEFKLKIEEIIPNTGKEFFAGIEPITVELKVKTIGGALDGKSTCYYRFDRNKDYIRFFEDYGDSDIHTQTFDSIVRGNYDIDVQCIDLAEDVVENSTSFRLEIDTVGPRIIRAYFKNGLKIFTSEDSKCRYWFDRRTLWENATEMSGDGFEHVADWEQNKYYIQCEDIFYNKGSKKVVRAYSLSN
tara:strand:+ start:1172 stop:4951 length:3780 start_codon:yes stop_codon:yes gene_type:complete